MNEAINLKEILELHRLWLEGDDKGSRANLIGANLYSANLTGANLYGANLTGANLIGADLIGANLYGANLYGADLTRADLTGANLIGANLIGADLIGANLIGAKVPWTSHNMLSEILFRAAGNDVQKRMVAGLIRISTDWCWTEFLKIETETEREWALSELAKWIQPGDTHPKILDQYVSVEAKEGTGL